jgi:hypothetical protein
MEREMQAKKTVTWIIALLHFSAQRSLLLRNMEALTLILA